jgi:hypothetical protein
MSFLELNGVDRMSDIMPDKMTDENILKYMEIQWKDIHHSRQQEWTAMGVILEIDG